MASNGPRLNAICPYFTMFPIEFPKRVLRKATPSDWVLDPFCGRGTTNLAARTLGLNTIGIDSSPVAVAISQSKMVDVSPTEVVDLARHLLTQEPVDVPTDNFWDAAFSPETLRAICSFRESLIGLSDPAAVALRGLLLGALHGPIGKLTQSYFSNQSPRTFSPKPRYALQYWAQNNMQPPNADVISIIEARATRFFKDSLPKTTTAIHESDSRNPVTGAPQAGVNWIVTSPPYYGMKTYEQDQWLRLWLLGGPPHVDYGHPAQQLSHRSAREFTEDLRQVWLNTAQVATDNAKMVIRFGGINDRTQDPRSIIKNSLTNSGWTIDTLRTAEQPRNGRRQATQFATRTRSSRPEYDVYCTRNP